MSTEDYETLVEYRDGFLEKILDEERLRSNSPLQQTFGMLEPFDIGDLRVNETVVILARGTMSMEMLPDDNSLRITFHSAGAQMTFDAPDAPVAIMYDMTTQILIDGEVQSAESDDQLLVGLATGTVSVESSLVNGHPLDDDIFVGEVFESKLHEFYADGTLPVGPETSLEEDFGIFVADFSVEIENDIGTGGNPFRQLRAQVIAADRMRVDFPIDLRWSNIMATNSADEENFEPSIALHAVIQYQFDLQRQLDNSPAEVSVTILPEDTVIAAVEVYEGEDTADRPEVADIINQILQEQADEFGNELENSLDPIGALTIDEINETVAEMLQESLVENDEVLPFWQREQDDEVSDATPRVFESSLVIGINAEAGAEPDDIESFIPDGEDFATFIRGDLFLEQLDEFLHTPDTQDDLIGSCRVDGANQTGTELVVDGFDDGVSTLLTGTRFRVEGVSLTLVLDEAVDITDGSATLILSSPNEDSPDNNASVEFLSAFVAFESAQGNELPIQGLVRDSGTIKEGTRFSLENVADESINLPGDFTVVTDVDIEDGTATLLLDHQFDDGIPFGTRISWITGLGVPGVRFDAGGNDREVEINELTPSLQDGHVQLNGPITVHRPEAVLFKNIGGSVTIKMRLRWEDLPTGRVDGADQEGSSQLNVHLLEGIDSIPAGSIFEIEGVPGTARVAELTSVDNGRATVVLNGIVSGFPADQALVNFTFIPAGRTLENELVEDPDVELGADGLGQNIIDAIIGAVLGVFLTIFTAGGFIGALVFVISLFLREVIEKVAGGFAADELGSAVSPPVPSFLSDINVGIDSQFNNPILISSDGIVMSGSATPISEFRSFDDSQATTGGPYLATAGMNLDLVGGLIAAETDYDWTTGDGAELTGRTPAYVYARRGYRVAALTTVNHQFGSMIEVRNRSLGLVRVQNTQPVITAINEIVGLEGHEVELTAEFADTGWLDSHRAYVLFGDGSAPVLCEIVEANEPPLGTGTATAIYTYCDNGVYVVTIKVIDEHGGSATATTTATIANVPPVVDAGPDVYAHPCVPTRLVGQFEDVGWCDTHTGVWDFGDCSPLAAATINETNEAPAARGTATATRCYTTCGAYVAELTITDDDGAATTDSRIVRVVDLQNGCFEMGFWVGALGQVGNSWTPYVTEAGSTVATVREVFFCEECIVFDGRRSQGVRSSRVSLGTAGIFLQVLANVGWDYEFSAYVHAGFGQADFRIGVDPTGGTDPSSESIVWTTLSATDRWQPIASRADAIAMQVTVFVEVSNQTSESSYIDAVEMHAFPCPIDEPAESCDDEHETPEQSCVDLTTIDPSEIIGGDNSTGGMRFVTLDSSSLRFVQFGPPEGASKLSIPVPAGMRIEFVTPVDSVLVTVTTINDPVNLVAFASDGTLLASSTGNGTLGQPHDVAVDADTDAIVAVTLTGGTRPTLHRVCVGEKRCQVLNSDGKGSGGM